MKRQKVASISRITDSPFPLTVYLFPHCFPLLTCNQQTGIMKILKRLRDMKVMEDTLEGLEARKSLNRKAAYVSLSFAILLNIVSAGELNYWLLWYAMYTPAATIGMRGVAAVSVLLLYSKVNVVYRLLFNLPGKTPKLMFLRDSITSLIIHSYVEMLVASFFSFVVFPHQVTDQAMIDHYDKESFRAREYWYIIPSFYAMFFYFRMAADFLTFSFIDSFIKGTVKKEARMRELMNEETIRSSSLQSLESTIRDNESFLIEDPDPREQEYDNDNDPVSWLVLKRKRILIH